MKTFVIVTTFLSPHILPLLNEISNHYSIIGCIETKNITEERKRLGYDLVSPTFPCLSFSKEKLNCENLIFNADVVCMSCDRFELLETRIQKNKEVFILHERLFKKGWVKLLDPRMKKYIKLCSLAKLKPIYLLAIGKNSANDFRVLGFPKEKIYYYGYFPAVEITDARESVQFPVEILWVGRMVSFKRPLMAVRLAKLLSSDYHLTMIGDGKQMNHVKKYIEKHQIKVSIIGQLDNASVRDAMRHSDILLSTSNKGEGWGAVINEGMSCGCSIVCSDSIGCYGLLADETNAAIFSTHSMRDLYKAVQQVAMNLSYYSQKGIEKITTEFNPKEAAIRFYELERHLFDGLNSDIYQNGICSRMK